MSEVTASQVLFIKLGKGDSFAEECIDTGILKLDYHEVSHTDCLSGNWGQVRAHYIACNTKEGAATDFIRQLKLFYNSDENTIWIAFWKREMWWCKASQIIHLQSDGCKHRPVLNEWSNKDICGNVLPFSKISGKILAKAGYRGTICEYKNSDPEYILRKINGLRTEANISANSFKDKLVESLAELIRSLSWHDFELLVDQIFARGGWKRVSQLGGTMKDIDLDLEQPITGEKARVQIKSIAEIGSLDVFLNGCPTDYKYSLFFIHTPNKVITKNRLDYEQKGLKLFFAKDIAELCLDAGLTQWIIDKTT